MEKQQEVLIQQGKRWEAKVSTTLPNASTDQIWPLFADFFGLHKWFPGLSTCYGLSGDNGQHGCVRYCSGGSLSAIVGGDEKVTSSWSKERLVAIDHGGKSLSYEILDCNIGFKSYVSTIKIVDGESGKGCVIEWWFGVDNVEGMRLEDLIKKYEVGLHGMATKMSMSLK
ncbi:hypothetical protein LIER_09293 [Lithospermum erythrorhizon]|uniref:Lachrymatory factor synthase n=1 Tax=Lithospermum erythrorhizon TaxID=34254 RepID=A0AAV3PGC8_LITER